MFQHVVDQSGEYGGEREAFRRIDLRIVYVVQLGDIHPGDHFAGYVFFIDALFHSFFDVDFDFFEDEIGTFFLMRFENIGKSLCKHDNQHDVYCIPAVEVVFFKYLCKAVSFVFEYSLDNVSPVAECFFQFFQSYAYGF